MNQEYVRLQKLIGEAEEKAKAVDKDKIRFRNGFHIMPPTGWLNDPNGLCQLGGEYHLFFQYSPMDARGGMKAWGHYVTKDFVTLHYAGAPFVPDEDFDKNGVYSGSCYIDEAGMHIFYTGNVKLPGDYDYINSGRRADTVLVESNDGISFGEKRVVIDTDEYPDGYSCHIRDPKVWKENGTYYMVLGARTEEGTGEILVYCSDDMYKWSLYKVISSKKHFGYMWECPDIFKLDEFYVVSFSPQGLDAEEYRYQNTHQSGYVITCDNPIADTEKLILDEDHFVEWDMGFDFYAPQTFLDNSGRRILVGWAGVPDPGYENGEVEPENWQHCFTVPRKLEIKENGDGRKRVFQTPIEEIERLRTGNSSIADADNIYTTDNECLDIICNNISGEFSIGLAVDMGDKDMLKVDDHNIGQHAGVTFSYNGAELILSLTDECGFGRGVRRAEISEVHSLRILVDVSIVEFYVNDGEMVFTTRYYKTLNGTNIIFDVPGADINVYPMKRMKVD